VFECSFRNTSRASFAISTALVNKFSLSSFEKPFDSNPRMVACDTKGDSQHPTNEKHTGIRKFRV
jgi:hypothetical protein